ncbi:heavy metal-binding domain-containing protein [Brevundimonas variabilis]
MTALFTCPMHPQVSLPATGPCPICAAALQRERGPAKGSGQSGAG